MNFDFNFFCFSLLQVLARGHYAAFSSNKHSGSARNQTTKVLKAGKTSTPSLIHSMLGLPSSDEVYYLHCQSVEETSSQVNESSAHPSTLVRSRVERIKRRGYDRRSPCSDGQRCSRTVDIGSTKEDLVEGGPATTQQPGIRSDRVAVSRLVVNDFEENAQEAGDVGQEASYKLLRIPELLVRSEDDPDQRITMELKGIKKTSGAESLRSRISNP